MAVVHRGSAGDAGSYRQDTSLFWRVQRHITRVLGARADAAHISLANVHQLGRFIQFRLAQPAPYRCDVSVTSSGNAWPKLGRIDHHTAKLIHAKYLPVLANARTTMQDRPRRCKPD